MTGPALGGRRLGVVLVLACLGGSAPPARAQQIRQIPLDVARGEISRRYLPAADTFYFLVRASSELMELRGRYATGSGAAVELAPWTRLAGSKSRDATLKAGGLTAGASYNFEFTLVSRPTGNQGRLVETAVRDLMVDAFRAGPTLPLAEVEAAIAPRLRAELLAVLPGATTRPGSPFGGDPAPVDSALEARGLDVLQEDYRRQAATVGALAEEFLAARRTLAGEASLIGAIDTVSARLTRAGGFAELVAPRDACRSLVGAVPPRESPGIGTDADQVALLAMLKDFDARLGACRGFFRDVRLPALRALRPDGAALVADLLIPVEGRLEAFRSETERLLSLWRKREAAANQVAGDLRRSLDTQVTTAASVHTTFTADPGLGYPAGSSIGIGIAGVWAPCSVTTSCIRIVPEVNFGIKLSGPFTAELGLTLARTEAPGRTRHLFWFTSGMAGLSVRLGAMRSQRIGAGVLILRKENGDGFDSFHLGGYLGVTLIDFRL